MLATEDAPSWLVVPLLGVMVGYVLWPQRFRPILVSSLVLLLGGLVVFAHVHFRTILMVPLILFSGLGIVGIILSYYGEGPVAFLVGTGLSFLTSLIFPQNPIYTSPRSGEECSARVGLMDQNLSPFVDGRFIAPGVTRLPAKPEWSPVDRRPYLVEIGPEISWFGRDLPEDHVAAAAELRVRVEELLRQGHTPHIFLSVDTHQPVAKVATMLQELPPVDVWVLATRGPGPLGDVPAGAQAFVSKVDATDDQAEKGRILMQELSRRLGPCQAAAQGMSRIGDSPKQEWAQHTLEIVSRGLRECRCSYVDLDALEYLLKRILAVPAYEFSEKEVHRDSSGRLMIPTDSRLDFGQWVDTL